MSGGGGSKTRVVDYYMSTHWGVCAGPVDSVDKVFIDDKDIGVPSFGGNISTDVDNRELFGGKTKSGGVAGAIDYLFGADDQVPNQEMAYRFEKSLDLVPGFRGITSLFFRAASSDSYLFNLNNSNARGFLWHSNMPTLPPVAVTVTRYPVGPGAEKLRGPNGLANPAHMIFEILTNNDWGMGYPLGLIDVPSFVNAANTLVAEDFWLGMIWARSTTIENFCGEVLDHIQASLGPDPRSGKIRLKLLRDDYDVNNLKLIHPGNAEIKNIQRKLWGETANEISVSWTNPDSEETETITIHDDANIAIQGQTVTTSRNYYGVRNPDLAARLALRDLRQAASPLLAVDVELARSEWDIMPGDVVEFRWPEEGIVSMYMRVGDVDYGSNIDSKIKTSLLEDIFGLGSAVYQEYVQPKPGDPAPTYPPPGAGEIIVPETPVPVPPRPQDPVWVDPTVPPRALDHWIMGTTPYFLLARAFGDDGLAGLTYPSTSAFHLVSQNGAGTSAIVEWVSRTDVVGNITYQLGKVLPNSFRAKLAAAIVAEARTVIGIPTNVSGSQPNAGDIMVIGDMTDPEGHELAAIEAISSTGQITLRRAVMDTRPQAWPLGTTIWIFNPLSQTAFDATIRADGQIATYKFTPITTGGQYPLSSAPVVSVSVTDRPHLPYRPANVKCNTVAFGTINVTGLVSLVFTWARRNRVVETGQLLAWDDPDVMPEDGQTTFIAFVDNAGNELRRYAGLTGTTFTVPRVDLFDLTDTAKIRVGSTRGDLDSLTCHEFSASFAAVSGYGLRYGMNYGA